MVIVDCILWCKLPINCSIGLVYMAPAGGNGFMVITQWAHSLITTVNVSTKNLTPYFLLVRQSGDQWSGTLRRLIYGSFAITLAILLPPINVSGPLAKSAVIDKTDLEVWSIFFYISSTGLVAIFSLQLTQICNVSIIQNTFWWSPSMVDHHPEPNLVVIIIITIIIRSSSWWSSSSPPPSSEIQARKFKKCMWLAQPDLHLLHFRLL